MTFKVHYLPDLGDGESRLRIRGIDGQGLRLIKYNHVGLDDWICLWIFIMLWYFFSTTYNNGGST